MTAIGTVLRSRYRVDERLGEGSAADVFKATDERLDRKVVLKILKPHLAQDPAVIERFAREARHAARLSHPNIVKIHDIEESDDLRMIVMEYTPGVDLQRHRLAAGGRLPPRTAISIGRDILLALEYAHQQGLVHRDIKPHNVFITQDGIARLMDFGIAKALYGTETLTQTGSMVGTVQYFSPEQAQGFPINPQSDLYSVGVLLYELVTGRVPFDGDNPVAVALKHVQETSPTPRSIAPDVPEGLERVILKALNKNAADRYQTAAAMRADLEAALDARPKAPAGGTLLAPTPMPVVNHHTQVVETREPGVKPGAVMLFGSLLVLLVGVVLYAWWAGTALTVPDLMGRSEVEARQMLQARGLQMVVGDTRYNSGPPGTILEQKPPAGTRIQVGAQVTVVISSGGQEMDIPSVVGMKRRDAAAALESRGLKVKYRQVNHDTIAEEEVVSQDPPAGTVLPIGSEVTLDISQGPPRVSVPNLVGKTETEARELLMGKGLVLEVLDRRHVRDMDPGDIIEQKPRPGSMLRKKGTVGVIVSLGSPVIEVPDLSGLTLADARRRAKEAGLDVEVDGDPSPPADATVEEQNPSAGQRVVDVKVIHVRLAGGGQTPEPTSTEPNESNLIEVPNVMHIPVESARQELEDKGLRAGETEETVSDQPQGTVVGQSPAPGSKAPRGTEVVLTVSNGVPPATPETPLPDSPP